MQIQTVGIIGAGTMGNGIAHGVRRRASTSSMVDISDAAVSKGLATVASSLDRLLKKEKTTARRQERRPGAHQTSTRYDDLEGRRIVIEAATENYDLKVKILKQVDGIVGPDVIIASNTSSISITKLAAATSRPTSSSACTSSTPCPCDGAGGNHPRPADQRCHARRRQGHGQRRWAKPHHREECARLCGQSASWCP